MNENSFDIASPINVLQQTDGTTMYSVEASNYYDQLEALATKLSYSGKIIRYVAGCNFFFVVGEDTNLYSLPKKLKRLSAKEFQKLGWNVKFHKEAGQIWLIAKDANQLKEIVYLLKESGFMYKTQTGIENAVSVKPQKKKAKSSKTATNVA